MKKFLKNRIGNFSMLILLSLIFTACDSKTPTEPKPDLPDAPPPVFDSVVDARDGNVYKIVKIGEQWWMAENLRYKTEEARDYIISYSGEKRQIDYGFLYQWTDAMELDSSYLENNAYGDSLIRYPYRGICMEGFHIPQIDEFKTLLDYVDLHNGEESFVVSISNKNYGGGVDRFGFNHQNLSGYFYGYYITVSEIYEGWRKYMPYVYGLYSTTANPESIPIVEKKEFFYVRCLKD